MSFGPCLEQPTNGQWQIENAFSIPSDDFPVEPQPAKRKFWRGRRPARRPRSPRLEEFQHVLVQAGVALDEAEPFENPLDDEPAKSRFSPVVDLGPRVKLMKKRGRPAKRKFRPIKIKADSPPLERKTEIVIVYPNKKIIPKSKSEPEVEAVKKRRGRPPKTRPEVPCEPEPLVEGRRPGLRLSSVSSEDLVKVGRPVIYNLDGTERKKPGRKPKPKFNEVVERKKPGPKPKPKPELDLEQTETKKPEENLQNGKVRRKKRGRWNWRLKNQTAKAVKYTAKYEPDFVGRAVERLRIVERDGEYVCNKCGRSFKRKQFCVSHQNMHRTRFNCQRCAKTFVNKRFLVRHEMIVHPELSQPKHKNVA